MYRSKNRTILYLLCAGVLILNAGCLKQNYQPLNSITANVQEQKLLGKWSLKRSETYEVTGTDSSGQYQYNLIGSEICDSLCRIEFKRANFAKGSIGLCDTNSSFTWSVKQQNKIETGNGVKYDILYLSGDSVAFSNIYVKDILTLRSVMYYKR